MASVKPATDRPRQLPRSRFWPRVFGAVSVSAVALVPVAALVKVIGKALMAEMSAL